MRATLLLALISSLVVQSLEAANIASNSAPASIKLLDDTGPPRMCGPAACNFDVNVIPDANDPEKCYVVNFSPGTIIINKGTHPTINWHVKKLSGDTNDYQFTSKGIDIKNNDSTQDFDADGLSGGNKTFHWHSVNKRKSPSSPNDHRYDINVVRKVGGGWSAKTCDFKDPTMVNNGP